MTDRIRVTDGNVVLFDYKLTNESGAVIDESPPGKPMAYLHGHGNIIPGLESELVGLTVSDTKRVVVAPEQAYGVIDEAAYQKIHRREFPKGGALEEGMSLQAQDQDGNPHTLWVHEVKGAWVTVTPNHPLAGQTLNFEVKIAGIREASEEEQAHGHPHGPGGHHH